MATETVPIGGSFAAGFAPGEVILPPTFDPGGERGETGGQPVLSGSFDGVTDQW